MAFDFTGWRHGGKSLAGSVSSGGVFTPAIQSDSPSTVISRNLGQLYILNTGYSATSGDYTIYLKNNDTTRDLVVRRIVVSGTASSLWQLNEVTGTAAGTAAVPVNANLGSSNTASVTAFANAAVTGLSKVGETLLSQQNFSSTGEDMSVNDGVIVPEGFAIAINTTHAGASVIGTMIVFSMEPKVVAS